MDEGHEMSRVTASTALKRMPTGRFVRARDLPVNPGAARKTLSRAASEGSLAKVAQGLYYKGVRTRYGMTRPRPLDIAMELLAESGVGPSGHSAAHAWGVTTQVPATAHVAAVGSTKALPSVTISRRSNLARLRLPPLEIALLELLRDPRTMEAGWSAFVSAVSVAEERGMIRLSRVGDAVAHERHALAKANHSRLVSDVAHLAARN